VTTREERREERERRAEMKARFPCCRWYRKPAVAGQVDGEGVPSHYSCQLAFLALKKPSLREVPMNPRLPHHRRETPDVEATPQHPKGDPRRHGDDPQQDPAHPAAAPEDRARAPGCNTEGAQDAQGEAMRCAGSLKMFWHKVIR
jgi:hypothetical protein